MADEDLTVASEPAEPTIAEPTVVDEPEALPDPLAVQDEPAPPVEDDGEDFEWEGQQLRGPKGIKDSILRHSDYTKKTQEIAAQRKELESRETEINQRRQVSDEELDARAALKTVNSEIERFKDYDYQAYQQHYQQDPMAAAQAWAYKQDLMARKGDVEAAIGKAQQTRTEEAQRDFAKRLQETTDFAAKNIPGWSDDHAGKLVEFATGNGASMEFLRTNMSPALMQMIHWAHIGKQTLSTPAPKPATVPATPLKIVAAKSAPTNRTDLASMSMDEYVAARKRGVGGKALA